jgi:hypothetical protein
MPPTPFRFPILCAVALAAGAWSHAAEATLIEVVAGDSPRRDALVSWDLPADLKLPGAWKLVGVEDGKDVPVQVEAGAARVAFWLLAGELPAGARRRYRIAEGAPAAAAAECADVGGKHLLLRTGGKDVLRYNHGVVEPPSGVEPLFARSGYIHPAWTPAGRAVTNDFPLNHKHHHGIWMPWTNAEFEGRKVNFWEQGYGLGKVECTGVDARVSGPVFAGFRARHRFTDLKAPEGPKPALDEVWEVKAWAAGKYHVMDFLSVQTCAGSSPLILKEYRYGGFGFRGSGEWEGAAGCEFLTSEGKTRKDGHATRARWCEVRGKVGGETCGVAFLCHPANFRFPQPMRIHDTEPFFNFTPCQAGDFAIEPGKPYVSRYRLVIHDGTIEPAEIERLWKDYADPPRVEVVKG